MADAQGPPTPPEPTTTGNDNAIQSPAGPWMLQLDSLLEELQNVTTPSAAPPLISPSTDNQLVQVRLGIAASLFTALRCKHAPTAAHGLRVALGASAWCIKMELPDKQRDIMEIAALLHDLGVIGVPDQILHKPGELNRNELKVIERSRKMSVEILRSACAESAILEIVKNVPAWYDGSKSHYRVSGNDIPFGARMIAILESYDSMTTDHVFRPAMSRELAVTELFACAGTQFDPELVDQFVQFQEYDHSPFRREIANRWLRALAPDAVESYWELNRVVSLGDSSSAHDRFLATLLSNMHNAVVFVDSTLKVKMWNHGAERMTGISSDSICQRRWHPDLLNMRDEKGNPMAQADCPVAGAIHSGVQSLRRLVIWGRTGRPINVDTHAVPVLDDDGTTLGAVLLLHDASPEASLEARCQSLHEKATKDSLTQVANRAEFDRANETFVTAHLQRKLSCTLIICDLDHFKQVNDTYGHQAGDEVIKSLAVVLKNCCRPGDLVARYGGEEFVVLCANCDNAAGARRAEQVRRVLCEIPQPKMGGKSVSASFGVTELQPGDTPETMLRRADRALLMAKAKGRNMVVQLGSGSATDESGRALISWSHRSSRSSDPEVLLEQDLLTPVPISVAIEKLRGFVFDHRAEIAEVNGNEVVLHLDDNWPRWKRRRSDRAVSFAIKLRFREEQFTRDDPDSDAPPSKGISRTRIHIAISPQRDRDRRRADVLHRARQVLLSFRCYLIAIEEGLPSTGMLDKAKRMLTPWLLKK